MQQNENNAYNLSDELRKEIMRKTISNQENKENVSMISTNGIAPLIKEGGYRTPKEFSKLINNIKEKGIVNPIEVIADKNGKLEVYNGNHRLKAAIELGLDEVPIKIISDIDFTDNKSYNNEKVNYYDLGGKGNGSNDIRNEINRHNEGNESNTRYNSKNSNLFGNKGTTTGNDRLLRGMEGYNDRPSSPTTYEKNNFQQFLKDTIDDGGKIYKNKKTNDWLNFNRFQLPKESNSLVRNNTISGNNKNVNSDIVTNSNMQQNEKKAIKEKNNPDILYETKEPNDVLVI